MNTYTKCQYKSVGCLLDNFESVRKPLGQVRKVRRSGIMLPLSIHAQSPFQVGLKQRISHKNNIAPMRKIGEGVHYVKESD